MKIKNITLKGLAMTPKILLAGIVAIALSTGLASAQSDDTKTYVEPSISFAQAMDIALATDNGDLLTLATVRGKATPHYFAELKGETSYTVLRIDGETGDIVNTRQITASSPEELHAKMTENRHKGHHKKHRGRSRDHDDDDDDHHGRRWFKWF